MLPEQKLDALLARHQTVETELASGLAPEAYVKLSREFAELGPVIETIKAYRAATSEIADLASLLDDAATDPEMRTMAASEKPALEARLADLEGAPVERVLVGGDGEDELDHDRVPDLDPDPNVRRRSNHGSMIIEPGWVCACPF